jgi:hypothetical protein
MEGSPSVAMRHVSSHTDLPDQAAFHSVLLLTEEPDSMTFHRGQGGNNALRDAERFVSAMKEVKDGARSLRDAVDAYDQDVFERGLNEVDMSSKQTHAFHDYDAFLQSPLMKHGIKPTANLGTK